MGNNSSSDQTREVELRPGIKSKLYPWKDLVKYVYDKADGPKQDLTENLTVQIIDGIYDAVRDITDGTNQDIMDKLGLEGSFQPPIDWCVAVLEQNEGLAKARYNCVPRFVDEESFWCRYFNQIILLIRDEFEKFDIHLDWEVIS